jgi:hypothetical protein
MCVGVRQASVIVRVYVGAEKTHCHPVGCPGMSNVQFVFSCLLSLKMVISNPR